MKKNYLSAFLFTVLAAGLFSCTKFDYDDNVVKGDPPPIAGGYTNSNQVAKDNIVAYWSFNNTLTDSITNTDAVSTNTSFGEGIEGGALQGAENGYVIAKPSDAVKSLGAYSILYWVNSPLNENGVAGMINFNDNTGFWGNINTFFENGGTASLARFKALFSVGGRVFDAGIQEVQNGFNRWMHIGITYNGIDSFSVYVDGAKAGGAGPISTFASEPLVPKPFQNFSSIIFGTVQFQTTPSETSGSTSQPWANFLTGRLDEVRIYDKELSATEVAAVQKLQKQGR